MKTKDLLVSVTIAMLLTWGIRAFVERLSSGKTDEVVSGRVLSQADAALLASAVSGDVVFPDESTPHEARLTQVKTARGTYQFSSAGAVLEKLEYSRPQQETAQPIIATLGGEAVCQGRLFLTAFEGVTPYAYELVEQSSQDGMHRLVYQAKTEAGNVVKTFVMHDDSFQIDMTLQVIPAAPGQLAKPRLFIPVPFVEDLQESEKIRGLAADEKGNLLLLSQKALRDKIVVAPTLLGADSRYFVASLTGDKDSFARRGFFMQKDTALTAVIQGPDVAQEQTWQLSFYCGPKDAQELNAVNKQLEKTLDFGWLALLARLLLTFLQFLFGIVHNYGIAIILLTLIIKLVLWPLTIRGERSMKKQAEFQKRLAYLEQKYKHDKDQLNHEKMELMRRSGISSLGCLIPIVTQLPLVIGLNRVLSSSIALYKAPFALWIQDLSAKDPYYILPLLLGIGFVVQMSMTQGGKARQNFSSFLFSLFIVAVTANLSAGLTLFIAINTWIGLGQSYIYAKARSRGYLS
jgi:YidC/Oxa1 family membrane protein insertase